MRITRDDSESGPREIQLIGPVADQAELSGILNSIYELHLVLISVEFLDP